MKAQAKQLLFRAAETIGALRLLGDSGWRRRRLLILGYHGISLADEHEWNPYLFVTPTQLDQRLTAIRASGCTVLPLDEAIRRLYDGSLPSRSVVLTFDDGFSNFHDKALPLLRKHRMPATVYLSTYYVDHGWPVPYVSADYLLWRSRRSGPVQIRAIPGFPEPVDPGSQDVRQRVHTAFVRFADEQGLDGQAKDDLLRALAADLRVDYDTFSERERIMRLVTEQQIRACVESGLVDFELHTHRHRVPADRDLFDREIAENRDRIHALTGRAPDHFCYPSGVWDREFFPWLDERRVMSATTCMHALCSPASNRLLLPRFLDHSKTSPLEFEAWLCGFAEHLPSRHGVSGM